MSVFADTAITSASSAARLRVFYYCPKCHRQLRDFAFSYCPYCGARLEQV